MSFFKATVSHVFVLIMAMAMVCFSSGAIAEQDSPNSAQATSTSDVAKVRQKIQQINARLQEIQTQTLASNKDLVTQRNEFQGLLDGVMKDNGFKSTATLDRLKVIVEKLQGGSISEEEQQRLQKEYQQKSQQLRLAQRKAMQNEDVQAARSAYIEELVGAMKEQNPATETLIAELNTAQKQYQAMMQSSQSP